MNISVWINRTNIGIIGEQPGEKSENSQPKNYLVTKTGGDPLNKPFSTTHIAISFRVT